MIISRFLTLLQKHTLYVTLTNKPFKRLIIKSIHSPQLKSWAMNINLLKWFLTIYQITYLFSKLLQSVIHPALLVFNLKE